MYKCPGKAFQASGIALFLTSSILHELYEKSKHKSITLKCLQYMIWYTKNLVTQTTNAWSVLKIENWAKFSWTKNLQRYFRRYNMQYTNAWKLLNRNVIVLQKLNKYINKHHPISHKYIYLPII